MKARRSWVFKLISIRSVPIFLHGSFLFLVGWILLGSGSSAHVIALNILFTAAIFLCVLLHECGHVFTAQGFGIKTRDITLYPFGGIATLINEPSPKQELIIALAGPAVNIIIALLLYPLTELAHPWDLQAERSILSSLYIANLTLALFNLIPALPMDGGRVLRSILSLLRVKSATTISARISQVVSVGMGLYGLTYNQPMLVVISIFVFLGSFQEMLYVRTKSAVTGRVAGDLVCEWDKLYSFTHGTTLAGAMNIALRTTQEYFPIVYQGKLLGVTHREDLIRGTASTGEELYISAFMNRDFLTVDTGTPLSEALKIASEGDVEFLAVCHEGEFIGILYPKNITEFMIIDGLRQSRPTPEEYTE